MDAEIGSLEVGKKADMSVIDLTGSHLYPRQSLASAVVYQALGTEVETVIVGGRVILDGRRVPVGRLLRRSDQLLCGRQASSEGNLLRAPKQT